MLNLMGLTNAQPLGAGGDFGFRAFAPVVARFAVQATANAVQPRSGTTQI